MLVMGFVPWATSSIMIMFVLLFLCGWFRGWAGRRADHGALVVAERARRDCLGVELRA